MASRTTSLLTTPPLPMEDLHLILSHTAPLWEEMRGKSLFVTGGTGFFGCWLLESFCYINRALDLQACATVLTRNPEAFRAKCPHLSRENAITLIAGDIRDFSFPDGEFSHAVHAATETSTESSVEAQIDLLDSIARGTERMLQFAGTHGVRKLLLTSSGAVYGRQPPGITHLPETYSGAPDSLNISDCYGEGKRFAELLCGLYGERYGIECKIARCWAFCGPHLPLNRHFAIGNFIADALDGRVIRINGDGTPRRSYLYAADLAIWLWTILFCAPSLIPMNVGSDRDLSILELAHAVTSTLNPETEIVVAKSASSGTSPARYVPSIARAKEILGLSQTIGLDEGIRRTGAWHRSLFVRDAN